jgi:hypothetical protein
MKQQLKLESLAYEKAYQKHEEMLNEVQSLGNPLVPQ